MVHFTRYNRGTKREHVREGDSMEELLLILPILQHDQIIKLRDYSAALVAEQDAVTSDRQESGHNPLTAADAPA